MKKLLKNKIGMTLIEVILALSILAVVVVPLSVGFMNSLKIRESSDRQIDINEVSRIIKEQVTNVIRGDDHAVRERVDDPTETGSDFDDRNIYGYEKLEIYESDNENIEDYYFDVELIEDDVEGLGIVEVEINIYNNSEELKNTFRLLVRVRGGE
ncbi:prepilin-type N-terminal cleavage/methylation domain-containing protein [Herbivorax sp. ANBcel31]|uniref:prepilin-type N-terminal cleavage/methylation domain-containing protein n=1 Tax=Herbivorax sp. ANBcel31 TaxID=3069754 RepID=UPI0027B43EAA|nr:prepilin-type N-terminal cleavage/methylation domain-containing protein [Herbivorax sp. ANBcel31]MDQ2085838.1 prepilin-type N-terminal cleavage/methylation domain-containing protein [Herbivorax sp. ANBcel31]